MIVHADTVITNIPLFAELMYGPAEGTGGEGFPDNSDKEHIRRGYREDVDNSPLLESEDNSQ